MDVFNAQCLHLSHGGLHSQHFAGSRSYLYVFALLCTLTIEFHGIDPDKAKTALLSQAFEGLASMLFVICHRKLCYFILRLEK